MASTHRPLRLILVTHSAECADRVRAVLADHELVRAVRIDQARRELALADADCLLLDLDLPEAPGTAGIDRLVAAQVPIIALAGRADDATRVIRAGAQDLVTRDDPAALPRVVRTAVERQRTGERREVERLVREVAAEVRSGPPARRPGVPALGIAVLIVAFCIQLAVLHHPGGVVLWALFAAAAVVAWRAARGRRDDARLLETIVEGSADGVFVKDLEGRYLLANETAARLLGLDRDSVVGRTDEELFGDEASAARRARDAAVLATGETRRYWRTVTVSGSERTLSVIKAPFRDGRGRIVGLIGTVRDETVIRRLQQETGRFFDLAPDMLCTAGADGRLERVNEAWTAVLGWTADELRSRPLIDFVHPDDRARAARELELMFAGRIDGCATRLATRAGGWRAIEWTARVVPEDARIYAVARDVTERNKMEGALAASEARYRTLVHNLPNSGVVMFDHDLRYTFAAGQLATVDEDVVGRTLAEVWPQHAAMLTPRYRAALGGHEQAFEMAADPGDFWVQIAPLRDGDGAIEGGMLLVQDISAVRRAEREAVEADERFKTAFEEAPIGMGMVTPEGRYLRVNRALCEITGYTEEQLLRTTCDAITHPDDVAAGERGRADLVAGRSPIHSTEKRYLHANGHTVWVSVHATLVRDADGNPSHILGQIQDITDRRRFEERLQHLVDHDPLTGLFNRRRFEQELDRHVAHVERYGPGGALLVLDLDDFKSVNDTLGHNAGDELIVTVGGLLRCQLRDSDIVARLGGDEFAILLPAGGADEAEAVAAKLVQAVRDEITVVGARRARRVTTSVGVAPFGDGDVTGEEMLVNADLAMYEAKEGGRDRYAVYAADRHEPPRVQARMHWVERIRDALEDDRFVLHAQPILDLRTDDVAQYELLIRMLDDHGDLIPPGTFLQVAERFDLVQEIDRWVAGRALELIAEHEGALRLTVNLSGRTLTDDRLLAELEAGIARTGADPGCLTFEVTETAAVANIHLAREFAERLRNIGCRFALDDFGAGFGSFYYLKHLPFDYLKIDGEFVSNCLSNRTDQLVIRAVVDIAQGLGKETVAEFAADAELVQFLRTQGVDYAQGFHVGRPLPLPEALAAAR
ncbi:MAG TPA: PAS domain S-box protein [Solirubrobacteraceae bacterium]|nr:PAS domain S-box protein [Solirubrobacteraceae bacterium]